MNQRQPRSPTALIDRKQNQKWAFTIWAGGTFDISILRLDDGLFEVLATNGNTQLGGDVSTTQLSSMCWQDSVRQSDAAISPGLREMVIDAKHRLSFEENATIRLRSSAQPTWRCSCLEQSWRKSLNRR